MAEGTVLSLRDGTVSVTYEFLAGQIELNPTFDQPNLAGLILPQSCKYVDDYAFAGAKNMKMCIRDRYIAWRKILKGLLEAS